MRRKHPTTIIIAHSYRPRQYYEPIAKKAKDYWREHLPGLGERGIDFLNTFKAIIALMHGSADLSGQDALSVLADWAVHNVVRDGEEE